MSFCRRACNASASSDVTFERTSFISYHFTRFNLYHSVIIFSFWNMRRYFINNSFVIFKFSTVRSSIKNQYTKLSGLLVG